MKIIKVWEFEKIFSTLGMSNAIDVLTVDILEGSWWWKKVRTVSLYRDHGALSWCWMDTGKTVGNAESQEYVNDVLREWKAEQQHKKISSRIIQHILEKPL